MYLGYIFVVVAVSPGYIFVNMGTILPGTGC